MKVKPLGHHFFTTSQVPTFVLDGQKPKAQIQGQKADSQPAPADACPGINGEGAVPWLRLTDNGSGFSAGTPLAGGEVYRVETAGGAAPKSCAGESGDILAADDVVVLVEARVPVALGTGLDGLGQAAGDEEAGLIGHRLSSRVGR